MPAHQTPAWKALHEHAERVIAHAHLRDLLADPERCAAFTVDSFRDFLLDYSRQRATPQTLELLCQLADETGLRDRVDALFRGDEINATEKRAVQHVALRAPRTASPLPIDARVVDEVHAVLDRVHRFTDDVRAGRWLGAAGEPLTDVVCVGIGGSYLGPEFVYEALRTEPEASRAAAGRRLRFLANVDPIDVKRALDGLAPERTLVVVVSKTFTTAETMLNARTLKKWIVDAHAGDASVVARHMVAVSSNAEAVRAFGIDPHRAMFGFWDWVGGRYSVCSAVGVVPLSLQYGFETVRRFLDGAHDMDVHFYSLRGEYRRNMPIVLGLLGVWNATFLGYPARALLPYCQALLKLAPHIQQVDMESNGKRVDMDGNPLPAGHLAGPVNFGEPGTNGQHSFYQLMHQGRPVPADFIGFRRSQAPIDLRGSGDADAHPVSNHDELMSNFFAQPDALALGKTADEVRAEGGASLHESLVPHKVFPGNRPSSSLLCDTLDARTLGAMLALFEHRTAVEGFLWGINSFDQWGVELGKVLAKRVRDELAKARQLAASAAAAGGERAAPLQVDDMNASTNALLRSYTSETTHEAAAEQQQRREKQKSE